MIDQKMITMDDATTEIRQVLQRFQDGYTLRDIQQLEEFMKLFVPGSDAELIGIGASAIVLCNRYTTDVLNTADLIAQAVFEEK